MPNPGPEQDQIDLTAAWRKIDRDGRENILLGVP